MTSFSKKKADEYYQALLDRNTAYVGIFYVGVKTTSVFCISNCRARKPKRENVEFFPTFKVAITNGFRPCKICKPTENANESPIEVKNAIKLVKNNPKEKISDFKLRENGISPDKVRRWFKKNYSLTFHAFQRMYRINNAYKELKDGKKTINTAYDTGYESLSGFGYTYKKIIGKSPTKSANKQIILINRLTTPLGCLFICATDRGICLLEFTDRKMLETEFKDLQKAHNAKILIGQNMHTKQAKKELEEYFKGERQTFDVSIDALGSEFQKNVWNLLAKIPFGTTTTYSKLAKKLSSTTTVKSIKRANGFNRIAIIVPCHRVTREDGNLIGYGGGIERKKWLLNHEKSCKPKLIEVSKRSN